MSNSSRRFVLGLGLFTACFVLIASDCKADQKVVVGRAVPDSQRVPIERVDHAAWNGLLHKYVDRQGYVNYTAWKASAADQKALDDYLDTLSSAHISDSASR